MKNDIVVVFFGLLTTITYLSFICNNIGSSDTLNTKIDRVGPWLDARESVKSI